MGTYVDLVLRIPPARFRALVAVEEEHDEEDGTHQVAGGMPVYFGEDHVSLCTLNGAGWTPAELLAEARGALGAAVLDEAGLDGTALSLEGGGEPARWEARLAAYPHCTGAVLDERADDKLIDLLASRSPSLKEVVDVTKGVQDAARRRLLASLAWLDAQPEERFRDRPPRPEWPEEPDDAALEAIEGEE